jgi:hypothetical protein
MQGRHVLQLEWSESLNGTIQALFPVPGSEATSGVEADYDRLLMVFDEGKIAICTYERSRRTLHTIEIWNAEEGAVGPGTSTCIYCPSWPASRSLVVLPLSTIRQGKLMVVLQGRTIPVIHVEGVHLRVLEPIL